MKFSKKTGLLAAAAIICSGITVTSIITATEYSTEDPLISKSWVDNIFYPQIVQYVDTKINEVTTLIDGKVAELTGKINTAPTQPSENAQEGSAETSSNVTVSADTSYTVITLSAGQRLCALEGSLEIILRPGGTATVYSEIEGNGIADLTSGTELMSGDSVPINAYCLIPRADGRGIVCSSETAYVMVRGKYVVS